MGRRRGAWDCGPLDRSTIGLGQPEASISHDIRPAPLARLRAVARRIVVAALVFVLWSLGCGSLRAAGVFDDLDTLKSAIAASHREPEDFFRADAAMRDMALRHAGNVLFHMNKKKNKTEDDSELFIQSLELVSFIVDPRAEDILLSDPAFGTGWIVFRGVARQDPATVIPKLMALFENNPKTKFDFDVRVGAGYVYGTMFENGRLSAESPYYIKIRRQLLALRASPKHNERYVAVFALRSLPQDAVVTAALEQLAKDTSLGDAIRHNAASALAERAERFKAGAPAPAP